MSTLITGVGVESAHSQLYSRELAPKFGEKYFSDKYHVKFGHFVRFS